MPNRSPASCSTARRARQHRACLDRIVQVDDRRRDDPCALQGQRTGADRPDRRPRATDDRQSAGLAAVRRIQLDPPAGGLLRQALAGPAGSADHRGSRRTRLRGGVLVHHRRAGQDVEGDHRHGSTPASTSFSRPRTASRGCASSAPSRPAGRPRTCKPTCWRKPRSGARSPSSPASSPMTSAVDADAPRRSDFVRPIADINCGDVDKRPQSLTCHKTCLTDEHRVSAITIVQSAAAAPIDQANHDREQPSARRGCLDAQFAAVAVTILFSVVALTLPTHSWGHPKIPSLAAAARMYDCRRAFIEEGAA